MSKTNNDNIEDFFRKGLSQQESPYMEDDWKKMEKLLNAHEAGRAAVGFPTSAKVVVASAIVLLLVTSTLFVMNNPGNATSEKDKGLSTKNQAALGPKALESKDGNPSAVLISPEDKKSSEDNTVTEQSINIIQTPSTAKQTFTKDKNAERSEEVSQLATKKGGNITIESSQEKQKLSPGVANSIETPIETKAQNGLIISPNSDPTGVSPERSGSIAELTTKESDSPAMDTVASKTLLILPTETKEEVKEPAAPLAKVPSRWSVAMVISPDYSATQLGHFTTPGKSYGLLVGFNITKRLSLLSGLFSSTKLYTGYGSDYQPPAGYWKYKTNGVVPDEIDGACDVLEIPFKFQYDALQRPKSRLYGSLGMTSYLITREKYNYCFNNPNPGAASGWSTDKSHTYPFNVGYVGLGYEHQLTTHLSAGIEPFVKIPFKGMGWSNVNIYSTGAYLNVRYRFLKKG